MRHGTPDVAAEIELLKKFGTRDVKDIINCKIKEKQKELIKEFLQQEPVVERNVQTPSRTYVYTYHNDWGNRDIGFRNQ